MLNAKVGQEKKPVCFLSGEIICVLADRGPVYPHHWPSWGNAVLPDSFEICHPRISGIRDKIRQMRGQNTLSFLSQSGIFRQAILSLFGQRQSHSVPLFLRLCPAGSLHSYFMVSAPISKQQRQVKRKQTLATALKNTSKLSIASWATARFHKECVLAALLGPCSERKKTQNLKLCFQRS